MRARRPAGSVLTAAAWLSLGPVLLACSVLVEGELEGKDFGVREDGGSSQDGGSDAGQDDAGGGGGSGGSSGSGGSGPEDGGTDASFDAGTDAGDAGVDSGPGDTLTVVSSSPDDGASTYYRFEDVEIVLSDAVEDVDDDQLVVTHRESGDDVPGNVSTDDDMVTFSPDDPILLAGHYDVVLSGEVTTADGTTLGDDYEFTFVIVTGFPEDQDYLDRNDTPGSSEPDVGVDDEGNAIVVWLQRGPGGGVAYTEPWVAHYRHGEGWDTPRALHSVSGTAYAPKIAVAPNGSAIAAWTHDPGIAAQPSRVVVSAYTTADGWTTPEPLDSDPDLSPRAQHVAVGMNRAGQGIVVWSRGANSSADGAGEFFFSKYAAGDFAPIEAMLYNGDPVAGGGGRIEADINAEGLGFVGAQIGLNQSLYGETEDGPWAPLHGEYDYSDVEGMAIALDENDVPHGGSNAPESSGVVVARVGMPNKDRVLTRADNETDPFVAIAATKDAVAAWRARSNTMGSTNSIWAVTFDHTEDDWELSAADVFPDREATDAPSPPDVAAYLDTGALIAWTANGELYTVERDSDGYGDATPRERVEEDALPVVRVAASKHGLGVLVWLEGDGLNPDRVAAQTFRGEP